MKNLLILSSLIITLLTTSNMVLAQSFNSNTNGVEVGYAMFYADYLHGQSTALGEIYNKYELTCAHLTHPKGTLLKVTRADNGKSVTVRVNDRGKFGDQLIIDLSWAAAFELDMIKEGKALVQAEVVGFSNTNPSNSQQGILTESNTASFSNQPTFDNSRFTTKSGNTSSTATSAPNFNYYPGSTNNANTNSGTRVSGDLTARSPFATQPSSFDTYSPPATSAYTSSTLNSGYGIQVGSYGVYDNAERQVEKLRQEGVSNTYIKESFNSNGRLYRIIIGSFSSRNAASEYLQGLRNRYLADGIVMNLGN